MFGLRFFFYFFGESTKHHQITELRQNTICKNKVRENCMISEKKYKEKTANRTSRTRNKKSIDHIWKHKVKH